VKSYGKNRTNKHTRTFTRTQYDLKVLAAGKSLRYCPLGKKNIEKSQDAWKSATPADVGFEW